jgi:phage pi2 protein 07
MKMYFTADEMHTPEYKEYVKWMANVWKLNDARNNRIKVENQALFELTRPVVTEKMLENTRQIGIALYPNIKEHRFMKKVLEKTK